MFFLQSLGQQQKCRFEDFSTLYPLQFFMMLANHVSPLEQLGTVVYCCSLFCLQGWAEQPLGMPGFPLCYLPEAQLPKGDVPTTLGGENC